ncbi:PREDICTED: myotubularin-related protein DDB_G0290005-like [Polistes canadensis]|uniref:myotubularin-related protein DDB_G0290005-like n=1 Tax=Polistes canadensis TaxID=91411 RepID=UPI000718E966|nr:PREDICTED: myotubularin-related protein DDB_G0290005-like [Polistes canadensis]XP_014615172.1 PREDICTED: myotubularin-related protein DDB_G0290005-like [Polistes canadensis]XP_014615180.1 PREDICTED: myotubularin-related protein DDB_G0290005-like [Polistes canadensis]
MGKTPKKAAPGGDERNSCVRRIKPTTASSKTSESEKQRESDYSSRPKLSNIQKKVLPSSAKKNKLHNTANSLNQLTKNLAKDTVKEVKVQSTLQHLRLVKQKMQSKLEEAESTSSSISIEKDDKEETVNDVDNKKEEAATKDSNANHTTDEQDSTTNTNIEKKTAESIDENTTTSTKNETIKSQDKENEKKDHLEENNKECDEKEQDEMQIHLRLDDSPAKSPDTTSTISIMNDENELEELPVIQVVNDDVKEKKSSQTESEAGTESCSVDIVESVTSELSEASEPPSQQETQKERENSELNAKNEILGINYDASVTLKDVQIKLNDCLKEKLKHVEVCESDDNISNLSASNTFGKTLRNISGRSAIDRFRHSSSYDFWVSPNNSQSTNISMSQSPQRETTNTKILRYSTGLSDVMSSNGSFVEGKRKFGDSPESNTTLKKQKTEQSSLLNTSMDIIRELRKPIQISTPNISYKVQSDKLNISEINDSNDKFLPTHTTEDGTKKWCVIM